MRNSIMQTASIKDRTYEGSKKKKPKYSTGLEEKYWKYLPGQNEERVLTSRILRSLPKTVQKFLLMAHAKHAAKYMEVI